MLGVALLCPTVLFFVEKARDRPWVRERPQAIRVVACPQLRVTISTLPETGWLGAAASTLACDRLRIRLGGRTESALPPAALVIPADVDGALVFEAKDAAARQRVTANARADAVVEGELDQGADYRVTLRLVDRLGNELGKGNGAHVSLVGAIRAASDMLVGDARLRPVPEDRTLEDLMPGASAEAVLAVHDLAAHALTPEHDELADACADVTARTDLGALAQVVARVCKRSAGDPEAGPWQGGAALPTPALEQELRRLFFSAHPRGDALWLPWERLHAPPRLP